MIPVTGMRNRLFFHFILIAELHFKMITGIDGGVQLKSGSLLPATQAYKESYYEQYAGKNSHNNPSAEKWMSHNRLLY